MIELPTRAQFTGMCNALESATRENVIGLASGHRNDRREIERLIDDLHDAWDELEEQIADLEALDEDTN